MECALGQTRLMDQGTAQQESFSRVCEEALGSNLALRGKEGEGKGGER